MHVWLDSKKVRLQPQAIIGSGGEADVYGLSPDRALKVFKSPRHPDFAGWPAAQKAASARIAEHQNKLREFPSGLPSRVVAPQVLAKSQKSRGRIAGYAMRRVAGAEPLYRFSEPRFRRTGVGAQHVVNVLRDLHGTVSAVHRAGAVIGDFNDLNVLVRGEEAHLIDSDSFQFGPYPCRVFTERFVDPTLCDSNAPAPVLQKPHTQSSDWFAFALLAFRSLLCVGPYGGVHAPKDAARRVPPARRMLARLTVFNPEVTYPKPAIPFRILPDELLAHFANVFERDFRVAFPAALLDGLEFETCDACGTEHARNICPNCAHGARRQVVLQVRGGVRGETVFQTDGVIVDSAVCADELRFLTWKEGAVHNYAGRPLRSAALGPELAPRCFGDDAVYGGTQANSSRRFWLDGPALMRDGTWFPERIGHVLPGRTRFWIGEQFGVGFYTTGRMRVGFVFGADRGGLNDQVELPGAEGELVRAHAVVGDDRAWLFTLESAAGKLRARCTVVDRAGRNLGTTTADAEETNWLALGETACALGPFLFVAADDGVRRIELVGRTPTVTRHFDKTAPFVDAACRLHTTSAGLFAVGNHRIVRIEMKGA